LSFFNHHYDTYCYLPVVGFLSFDEEPELYLVTAVLRLGNAGRSTPRLSLFRALTCLN